MKEKRKNITLTNESASAGIAAAEARTALPERLSESDQGQIDNSKLKRELAMERVKNALAQSENSELMHNNIILQLALKYNLKEGDIINEDGTIQRQSKEVNA